MCITSARATLSKTLIYSGEGVRNDNLVHVLAYQNNATSHAAGPNAMILPIPTNKEMGPDNIIDTRSFKSFLKDIADATKAKTLGMDSFSMNMTKGLSRGMAQVFESGSYTVVLAESVDQIPEALGRVAANKRPSLSEAFLDGFGKLYPNQPIALCCWDGTIKAEPLLWWYEPKHTDHVFIPTMDAHDGDAPRLSEAVDTDHLISVGHSEDQRSGLAEKVYYKDSIPDDVMSLLPKFVYGTKIGSTYKNGDMFVGTESLHTTSTDWKKLPKAYRGVAYAEASISGTEFVMSGWR